MCGPNYISRVEKAKRVWVIGRNESNVRQAACLEARLGQYAAYVPRLVLLYMKKPRATTLSKCLLRPGGASGSLAGLENT